VPTHGDGEGRGEAEDCDESGSAATESMDDECPTGLSHHAHAHHGRALPRAAHPADSEGEEDFHFYEAAAAEAAELEELKAMIGREAAPPRLSSSKSSLSAVGAAEIEELKSMIGRSAASSFAECSRPQAFEGGGVSVAA